MTVLLELKVRPLRLRATTDTGKQLTIPLQAEEGKGLLLLINV